MDRVPPYVWWALAAVVALTIANRARAARPLPPGSRGLVRGGKPPRPIQQYLYQRTDTHKHRGVDISAPQGSPIYAPAAGIVAAVWPDGRVSGYGNTVVLRHPANEQTLYAHLDRFAPGLATGQGVSPGQLLGYVGTTQKPRPPMTSAPHLHFEVHTAHTLAIREDNPPRTDPMVWLGSRGIPVGVA